MSGGASTRQRLLREAMRLFGENGYAATSIVMIEQAAGLSPGSGSLYKHFASKQELLEAGLEHVLRGTAELTEGLGQVAARPLPRRRAEARATLTAVMAETARAGMARMEQDRDVNRLLFRGLETFPPLMARVRDEELRRVQAATAGLLAGLAGRPGAPAPDRDWEAVATVFVGAVAHYWVLRDLFGDHPSGVDEDRFVAALAHLAAEAILAR